MLGSHFNKKFFLVAFFVKLFIGIIDPFAREAIFRVDIYDVKASTTTWSCILHITLLMVLAAIVCTPSSRQAFLRVSNQWKAAVFTSRSLALQVALRMVCLKKYHNINADKDNDHSTMEVGSNNNKVSGTEIFCL